MPETPGPEPVRLSLPGKQLTQTPLPRALQSASRGAGGDIDPFVNDRVVAATQVYDLSPTSRAAAAAEVQADIPPDGVLALEMEDGFTLFIRATSWPRIWRASTRMRSRMVPCISTRCAIAARRRAVSPTGW